VTLQERSDSITAPHHNHENFLVLVRCQSVYPAMVRSAQGRAPAMQPSVGAGHCGFAPEQIMQAFRTLIGALNGRERAR
jgi:hypothetical protein